jgi:hypothetical protein
MSEDRAVRGLVPDFEISRSHKESPMGLQKDTLAEFLSGIGGDRADSNGSDLHSKSVAEQRSSSCSLEI